MRSTTHLAPIPSRRSRGASGRLLGGLTTSVVLHLGAAMVLGAFSALDWIGAPQPPAVVAEEVEMVPVSSAEWAHNQGADPLPAPGAHSAAVHKAPPPEALPSGQVVDVAAGNGERPADAKYLAEHDNRVEKETRAREQTPFYAQAMPRQTTVHPDSKTAELKAPKGNQGTGTDDATRAEKSELAEREIPRTAAPPKVPTLERNEDGETRVPGDAPLTNGNAQRLQVRPGTLAGDDGQPGPDGKAGVPDAPAQNPSSGAAGAAVGAAPNDFLNGVPIGDGTFLNTREFKYASFFNRVKQRVGEQWNPNDVLRRRDPHGHAAAHKRVTVVDVTLDETGRVADVRVGQSCGVDFLDEEAVAAFERAQPFPNPPTGLLESDRHIRFRFGFHIDNEPGSLSPFRFRSGH